MSTLRATLALMLHAGLILFAAPLLAGLIRRLAARMLGRSGPPVAQPLRDLRRLLRRPAMHADSASFVSRIGPGIAFAATLAGAMLAPGFATGTILAGAADLLVLAGLLSLARGATVLAGMDAGTAFGGIGASRATTFSVYADPALLLVAFTLALLAGTTNLPAIADLLRDGALGLRVSLALALLTLVAVGLTESGRIPVDNSGTHLELAMAHEAMLLEFSGRDLAWLQWAGHLRLLVWCDLVVSGFLGFGAAHPSGSMLAWPFAIAAWAAKLVAVAVLLALCEASLARMRVFRVPEFLGVAVLLGLLAGILLFVSQGFS